MSEPLVLLPDIMCDARLFAPLLPALARARPVTVAPISAGERIEEIASDLLPLLPHRFALAGFGMGAMVAMEMLRRAPDRLRRVALASVTPLPETPQSSAALEPLIVGARAGRLEDVLRDINPAETLAPGPGRLRVQSTLSEMGRALGNEACVRQLRALQRRADQQAVLRRIKVPALVICGAHDARIPPKRHEFMAEMIPDAELLVLEDAGRMPTLEAPEAVAAALDALMRRPARTC